jgi:hypothetical protein
MKILISTGLANSQGRSFSNFESANLFCRGLLGRYPNIFYSIQDGNFGRSGTIDMEPVSFHSRHKNRILTGHLFTFSQNVLRDMALKKYPFNTLNKIDFKENQDHFSELISLIPDKVKF